eukprot:9726033-Heterocapsa_arctica.AAC.1
MSSHKNRQAGFSGSWSRGLKLYTVMCTNCEWMKDINNRVDLTYQQIVDKFGCMHILAKIEAGAIGATHK